MRLKSKAPQFYIKGNLFGLPLSSFKISEDYTLIVSKNARYIDLYYEEPAKSISITENSFTEEELVSLEQFYPREVILDPINSNIFYVKLPTRIARFAILENGEPKFIDIVRQFDSYILDSLWSFTFTADNNILTLRDDQLK